MEQQGGGIGADPMFESGQPYARSPMLEVGQPRVRFSLFENIYGQWKAGWRSDESVECGLSAYWLALFRLWKMWGLDAVEPYLQDELDMRKDPEPDEPALLISEVQRDCQPKVPVSCVVVTFVSWCRGEITDDEIRQQHGEEWLRRFRHLRETGLHGLALVLGGEVHWDVSESYVQEQSQGLSMWAGLPHPSVQATVLNETQGNNMHQRESPDSSDVIPDPNV